MASMRKPARYTLIALLAAAGAGGGVIWWQAGRPAVADPPVVEDLGQVDPQTAELITRTVAEVHAHPRDADRRGKLAMIYHANALLDSARPCYEQAIALDRRNPRWWYHLGHVRADLGDMEGAIEAVAEAIEVADPDEPNAALHWRPGLWLMRMGRNAEAEAAFRQAIRAKPDDPSGWTGLARALMGRGAYQEAADLLESKVIARRPDYGYAHHLLGTTYQRLGRAEEGRRELARSTDSTPILNDPWHDEVRAYAAGFGPTIQRAEMFFERGRPDLALAVLNGLRESHPTNPDLLNNIAEAHFAMNQPARAREVLQIAVDRNPRHFATHLNLSLAHEQTDDMRLALRHADEAIVLNPTSGSAYLQKGRLFALAQNYESAVEQLEKAVHYGVVKPDVLIMLGTMQGLLDRWQDAAETLTRVTERDPGNIDGLVALARARGELGDLGAGWSLLEQASKMSPGDPRLNAAAARLRELVQTPAPRQ